MAIIRHKQRLVHKQLVDVLQAGLAEMGWVNEPVLFAATPVTLVDYQPEERGKPIAPNTVAISMGDEQDDAGAELGSAMGGLQSVEIPLFVDIYGEQQAISIALGADVKYLLKNKVMPLLGWDGAPTGATLEIDDVFGPETPGEANTAGAENFKRHWRVVKARTITYFNE